MDPELIGVDVSGEQTVTFKPVPAGQTFSRRFSKGLFRKGREVPKAVWEIDRFASVLSCPLRTVITGR